MKIIFDNKKQKKEFMKALACSASCPGHFGIKEECEEVSEHGCVKCWKNAIETEVKEQC